MLILLIIAFGMLMGWLAQIILGRGQRSVNWPLALGAGVGGSFVGGLLISLISGDGLDIRPSGIIGSLLGAIIVSFVAMRFFDQ